MDISPIEFIILLLSIFRFTLLVVRESGPAELFAKTRKRMGVYYDEHSLCVGKNIVASALCCTWCTSIWIALGISFVVYWYPEIVYPILLPFALSGGVIILDKHRG